MMVPSIHLNGTSAETLRQQIDVAEQTTRIAIVALIDAAPNARDYYPQGPDAYGRAIAEHERRLNRIGAVYDELAALQRAIHDGGAAAPVTLPGVPR